MCEKQDISEPSKDQRTCTTAGRISTVYKLLGLGGWGERKRDIRGQQEKTCHSKTTGFLLPLILPLGNPLYSA